MQPTGYADAWAREMLPPAAEWPDFLFERPELKYPHRLNAAVELLDRAVANGHGERIAFYSEDKTITYGELLAEANRWAHVLREDLGLVAGGRVLIHGPNSVELALAWYSVIKAGGIAVMTMPLLREKELETIVRKADIRLALTDSRLAGPVDALLETGCGLKRVAQFGPNGAMASAARDKPTIFANCDTASDDIALIAFTSGTTGQPKACAHFHRSVLAMADTFGRHTLKLAPGDILAGTPPLAFTFGLGAFLVFPARFGAATAFPSKPGFEALCETIERYKATHSVTAPTGYRAMLALADFHDLSSLRAGVSAGEHLPAATWEAWKRTTGVSLVDGIGATEMIHIFISAAGEAIRPGATGQAVPGYQARVVGEDGKDVADGEIGRLAVKGPTGCLYLDDDRQAAYVKDGWNLTGDLYRKDENGYFWYVSRADDLIVSSGYNIAGPEVEQALLEHAAVAECAVIGEPHPERGMIVSAYVVAAPQIEGDDALADMLKAWVKSRIAPYKYPRKVTFIDALPKTQTGKVQRFRLRETEGV